MESIRTPRYHLAAFALVVGVHEVVVVVNVDHDVVVCYANVSAGCEIRILYDISPLQMFLTPLL